MNDFFKKLTDEINGHERIILMTHSTPDLDGMGSAIAFSEILNKMGKECYIVAPKKLINKSLIKAIDYLEDNKKIIPFKYEKTIDGDNNLLIIFDTDENNLVECEELLKEKDKIVIDHHSKGLNIIDSYLSYLNDNMSSTIEIICEYLKYLGISLDKYYYTVMFAGLYIDTNSFTLKITPKTFENASFLLSGGAENIKWQYFLKNSMEDILNIYSYIEKCVKLDKDIFLCEVDDRFSTPIDLALIVNKILKFEGVKMAFAVGMSSPTTVLISSRSNGEVDVSEIMKEFGGGGHHSAAAAKIESKTMEDVISHLKKYLREG